MEEAGSNKFFENAKKKATKIVHDNKRLSDVLTAAQSKYSNLDFSKFTIDSFKEKLGVMMRMIRAYKNGTYRVAPWKSIVMIIAGILYFVMPLDLVPDFIPITGLLDDFTVIAWVYRMLKEDIDNFKNWEETQIRTI